MPILEDSIRPFWLPGLNDVSGRVGKGLGGWIRDEDFQIYSPIQPTVFTLAVADASPLVIAYAGDLNRFATASIESAVSIARIGNLSRSTAWAIIKSYYSAFFAAHSILRMLGVAVSRLDGHQVQSINKIANIFGAASTVVTRGDYQCVFNLNDRKISCEKITANGVHEAFWKAFNTQMRRLSTDILNSKTGTKMNNQRASSKLVELCDKLCVSPAADGSWLSFMRNQVNYSQRWGAWYPYDQGNESAPFYDNRYIWQDPMDINLSIYGGQDLLRFKQTCNFLIALSRALVVDMSRRCSTGRSFHTYGTIAMMNFVRQP